MADTRRLRRGIVAHSNIRLIAHSPHRFTAHSLTAHSPFLSAARAFERLPHRPFASSPIRLIAPSPLPASVLPPPRLIASRRVEYSFRYAGRDETLQNRRRRSGRRRVD